MSQESAEIVRRFFDGYDGKDIMPAMRHYVDEIGSNPEAEAVLAVWAEDPSWRYAHPDIERGVPESSRKRRKGLKIVVSAVRFRPSPSHSQAVSGYLPGPLNPSGSTPVRQPLRAPVLPRRGAAERNPAEGDVTPRARVGAVGEFDIPSWDNADPRDAGRNFGGSYQLELVGPITGREVEDGVAAGRGYGARDLALEVNGPKRIPVVARRICRPVLPVGGRADIALVKIGRAHQVEGFGGPLHVGRCGRASELIRVGGMGCLARGR